MSDKAKTEAGGTEPAAGKRKKKKGKLPMILAIVAVLGGGGFFGLKGRSGPAGPPEPKIGADVVEMGEVLVNLKDGTTYARLNVGLQFDASFDVHHLEKTKPVVRDAIIVTLSSRHPSEVRTEEGKHELKVAIAAAINEALHAMHPADSKGGDEKPSGHSGKDHSSSERKGAAGGKHPDWHSQTGPVLKVYFSDFVTQ